jgi:hypothetical protein
MRTSGGNYSHVGKKVGPFGHVASIANEDMHESTIWPIGKPPCMGVAFRVKAESHHSDRSTHPIRDLEEAG